jgi:3-deoxy-D-manno-octulosonic-acid transferase
MISKWQSSRQAIWHDEDFLADVAPESFSVSYWRGLGASIKGSSSGRNTAWFIQHENRAMLLRHYYRGGLIARFNRDLFLGRQVASSRAMSEFMLLTAMRQQGLPVPRPVAARMLHVAGFWYRADIIVETIPGAEDLFRILCQRSLSALYWQSVGKAIRRLHDKDVWHADLNCHNILLDENADVWIVDFDRCEFRSEGPWRDANLARLHRSLTKESNKHPAFQWQPADWQYLLEGYQSTR